MLKLLGAIAALAAFAAGCGSNQESPSAAPETTATPTPEAVIEHHFEPGHSRAVRDYYGDAHDGEAGVEAEYHQPPRPATGGIGDAITLTGTNIGVRLAVTPMRIVDPADASRPARDGMRWVGVVLQLDSTGIAIHDDTLQDALLRYGPGRAARPVLGVKAACSRGFDDVVRIDVGASARGCLLFQVPASARPRQFQLALEQVPAAAGGRWRLP
jgi:hypothetical protein